MADVPKYWVGGAGYISPSGGTCVAQRLVVGDNVVAVSVVGTLLVRIPGGLTGHVHGDGTCNVTGDPAALTVPADAAATGETTITTSGAAGNITVTLVQTTVSNTSWISSWSAASGGNGGASVPTSADTANFDANSFTAASQTVTVNAAFSCLNMDWTGATNTPKLTMTSGVNLTYSGNITFIAAMTTSTTASGHLLPASGVSVTIRTNGLAVGLRMSFIQATSTVTLLDNLNNTNNNVIEVSAGALDTGGFTLTSSAGITISGAGVKTLTMGASTVNTPAWTYSGTNLTLTANTSTINVSGTGAFAGGTPTGSYNNINLNGTAHTISGTFTCINLTRTGTAASCTVTFNSDFTCTGTLTLNGNAADKRLSILGTASRLLCLAFAGNHCDSTANIPIVITNAGAGGTTFAGNGQTYPAVTQTGAGNYALTISGNNTFNVLTVNASSAAKTVTLTPASVQTIRNLQIPNHGKNIVTINTGGAAATIQGNVGIFEGSYLSLTNVVATNKYTYYAANSTDGGGNTNWIFGSPIRGGNSWWLLRKRLSRRTR